MSKLVIATVLFFLWVIFSVGACASPGRTIDLSKPGALDALQHSNPSHYQKIQQIMDGVLQQPESEVPRWIKVKFNGRDVSYGPVLLTSYPPKRRLTFTLDDTHYKAVVILKNLRGKIIPLK